tara:strand:- start:1661 stop:1885 length:225 start_codon:yes stop_codon:yes gene_type:complete
MTEEIVSCEVCGNPSDAYDNEFGWVCTPCQDNIDSDRYWADENEDDPYYDETCYDEDDGQPSEADEWETFDPDC